MTSLKAQERESHNMGTDFLLQWLIHVERRDKDEMQFQV